MSELALRLPDTFPPTWAGGWGEDVRGVFAEIVVGDAVLELRWIPPGRFVMGSPEDEVGRWEDEGPQHEVKISRGFWLGSTAVTQEQWKAVTGSEPSSFKGGNRPVEQVSWEDCVEFDRMLEVRLPGLGARLPTEAEWEYACRAGTASAFNDGSACTVADDRVDPALEELGWYDKNSGEETHSVGKKAANAWGLYDMHGNVWEWCGDWWQGSYLTAEMQTDPQGPTGGGGRVNRGGGWDDWAGFCRSACRFGFVPGNRNGNLGFRLATGQLPEGRERSESRGTEEPR